MSNDNGLHANSYSLIAAITAPTYSPLLKALASHGIAAYIQPSATHEADLYVDAERQSEAITVAQELVDKMRFEEIVAHYDDPLPLGHPKSDNPHLLGDSATPVLPASTRSLDEVNLDDDPEPFVPPNPGPMPLDWISRIGWLAVITGPLSIIVLGGLNELTSMVLFTATAVFALGLLTLLLHHSRRNDDHDPDGGAIL